MKTTKTKMLAIAGRCARSAKRKEIIDAIIRGHEYWKDNPDHPNQKVYDLAVSISSHLNQAGFTIVRQKGG